MLINILIYISIIFSIISSVCYILYLKYDHKKSDCENKSKYDKLSRIFIVIALVVLFILNLILVYRERRHKDILLTLQLGLVILPIAIIDSFL
jgi:heme/copper-type cytochrome/quinol oxidase subunit 2